MPFAAKTYPCQEHGEVAVPLSELMTAGKVEVYPEVTGHGYFDIDYRGGELVLIAKNYVGVIPINSRVRIHVLPRFPIVNILYLVQRANKAVQYLPGYARSYKVEKLKSGKPEDLFARSLLNCLVEITRNGLMHRYTSRDTSQGLRGRVLMGATVGKHIAKGIKYRQCRRITELSSDIPENRIIKDMLGHVARYFSQFGDKKTKEVAKRAAMLYTTFDRVSHLSGGKEEIARQALRHIRTLPGEYKSYERVLWLCYLMATRQGVSIETFGSAHIETIVVNLADVFEGYVREVIRDNMGKVLPGGVLLDGNVHQKPLFTQGVDYKVKPDIYLQKDGDTLLVLDAKYKPKLKSSDRYEVIAFCEALQSKQAIFISPSEQTKPNQTFLGRTPSGIELYEMRIDLSAADIGAEEERFIGDLAANLSAIKRQE